MSARIGTGGAISISALLGKSASRAKNAPEVRELPFFPLVLPSKTNADDSLKQSLLTGQIEKHISDVKAGDGNLSEGTGAALVDLKNQTSDLFANSDPKALRQYSGYLTIFGYDKKARFINGVGGASNAVDAVTKADDNAEAFQKKVEAYFSKKDDSTPATPVPPQPAVDVVA